MDVSGIHRIVRRMPSNRKSAKSRYTPTMKERRKAWLTSIALLLSAIVIAIAVLSPLRSILASPDQLRSTVEKSGLWAPTLSVVLEILQVVIAPIPGQAIDFANGYIFGGLVGSICSLLGIGIGSTFAIFIARRFGRPLVSRLITPKGVEQMKPYTRRSSQWFFFILFVLPGMPDDLLCYTIGLTSIPLSRAVTIALLGRIPKVVAAVLTGATGQHLSLWEFSLISVSVSGLLWLIVWKTPLAKKMNLPKMPGA